TGRPRLARRRGPRPRPPGAGRDGLLLATPPRRPPRRRPLRPGRLPGEGELAVHPAPARPHRRDRPAAVPARSESRTRRNPPVPPEDVPERFRPARRGDRSPRPARPPGT